MDDELKEILEEVNTIIDNTYYNEEYSYFKVSHISELIDYITNLQQKVEQYENPDDLTLFYMWIDEKAKDKMKELQQENERLKDELETMTFTAKVKQEAIDALIKRIDKAIEYINLYAGSENNYCLDYHDLNPLLNILKGDSNE